jgi:hypothetical protein
MVDLRALLQKMAAASIRRFGGAEKCLRSGSIAPRDHGSGVTSITVAICHWSLAWGLAEQ